MPDLPHRGRRPRWLRRSAGAGVISIAPLLDLTCIAVFVILGRESHGVDGGASWFLVVVWPFAAGWLVTALAVGLYTSRSRNVVRLGATATIGIAVALILRALLTHRDDPAAFIIVAYVFIVLSTVGWRVVPLTLSRMARS